LTRNRCNLACQCKKHRASFLNIAFRIPCIPIQCHDWKYKGFRIQGMVAGLCARAENLQQWRL
jgi:hypothetical protein